MQCPKCRKEIHDQATMCEFCGATIDRSQIAAGGKGENVLAGVVGAFLGSLLGAASIVIFDQLGFVAALSGLILAVCTLKGYELLGGTLTKKGIFISLVLMLVIPYFANQISSAISFMSYVGDSGDSISFSLAYQAVPMLLEPTGFDYGMYNYTFDSGSYTTSLLMIYGFAILGAFSTVRSVFKKK
ncbi:MAG: hypothetical protein Q4F17_11535 [Eubacteriales bacterium]|nr:hypothetical protein [Eubacteriales bacterium]